jgi:predicted O-methyltransferase YrrM
VLPVLSWLELVPADTHIVPRERDNHVDGNVSAFEIDTICRLVAHHKPRTIFEVGTFDGRTTLNMAAHSPSDAKVYTLDLPPEEVDGTALSIDTGDRKYIGKPKSGTRFFGTDVESKITQLLGDSGSFDLDPYLGKMDFIFVDGSHSYEYVLADSRNALRLLKHRGVILWHDYVRSGPTPWPGVVKAINELHESDARFAGMIQIAGTSIVMLAVPSVTSAATANTSIVSDSRQPEFLLADLHVSTRDRKIQSGATLEFNVTARNIGRAVWLASSSPIGPVRLGTHLLDAEGNWLNPDYSRNNLPSGSVSPGESVELDAHVAAPPPGRYIIEFDMVSEGVAWFSRNGSNTVRVEIEVV